MNNIITVSIYCITGFAFGAINNSIYKALSRLPAAEILAGRFFFATILVLPIILKNIKLLKTNNIKIHLAKGLTELIALSSYVIGFKIVPISNGTLITFIIPFWAIVFSKILLHEKVEYRRIISTSLIFTIILITLGVDKIALNTGIIVLLIGTIFSGLYDTLNRKCSTSENHLTSIFYFNLVIFSMSLPISIPTLVSITHKELLLLIALGIGSNILHICLIKASSLSNASFVSTFRYLEFVYSVIIGIIVFNEKPSRNLYFASILILIIQIVMTIYENHNSNQQKSKI